MKKAIFIIIVLVILAIAGFFYWQSTSQIVVTNFQECVDAGNPIMESYPRQCQHGEEVFVEEIEQNVGGDRDEHGCIGSAGYQWCGPKETCLRFWEEDCYESLEQEVQYTLANKYDKQASEVSITVTNQTDTHAVGSVSFAQGVAGGQWLAVKTGNMWDVVYDGNGSVNCDQLRSEYSFPDEILVPNFCD